MNRPDRAALKRDFERIRAVLHNDWNPVGVSGLPADEYDSYVWPILALLHQSADAAALADHLHEVEQFYFGRDTDRASLMPVAEKLLALQVESKEGDEP